MFGSEVTELGYLNNQFILVSKAVIYRGLSFVVISLMPNRAISITLKNNFNSKCNSVIEHKPNLAKF
jgi:uncharacterized LabA/DUF88 family protein